VYCWSADAAARILFTVSIFISKLALPASLVQVGTMGVLAAAVLSGALALWILRAAHVRRRETEP